MSRPIVVITGASSGIGAACVREFGSAGFRTVGVDIGPRSVADEHFVVDLAKPTCGATPPGAAVYAASKSGVTSLTKAMAVEWAPALRVNCILPGAVDTSMLLAGAGRTNQTIKEMGHRHPLGRVANPKEIARMVRFVAVEGSFMTGSAVVVDGGVLSRLSTE